MRRSAFFLMALAPAFVAAQEPVDIRVDAAVRQGPFKPIFSYFGYDEPNYTYMKYGPKLVGELAALSYAPVYIRAHNMLDSGDGTPGLKWGSTNAYTEDANGKPVYDWKIVDRIIDTYIHAKAKPYVEIGFMPEALSVQPEPYPRHPAGGQTRPTGPPRDDIIGSWSQANEGHGWSYPPKDYDKWGELARQWVLHSVERYGQAEVESWYWEVWNEPDASWWKGTPEEYDKLYDYTARGVKKALPTARIGGPATTSPNNPNSAAFLKQFLEHCAAGHTPLDFISYHVKGQPRVVEGHAEMGLNREMTGAERGIQIINGFPQYAKLPIVLSEADPDVCAACSVRTYSKDEYRNGTLYPVYIAAAVSNIFKLADRNQGNMEGMVTWAFEFEDQPYFDGFRTLATNGIDKPVLNVFRMLGMMRGDRVKVESSGAIDVDTLAQTGVRQKPDIDALAARSDRDIAVLAWNYHDDDVPGPAAPVRVSLSGIPAAAGRVLLSHYRLDQDHSNAYTVWKQMGSPQNPTPEQYAQLEAAGQLQLLESPRWVVSQGGRIDVTFVLPRQGVSLIRLTW